MMKELFFLTEEGAKEIQEQRDEYNALMNRIRGKKRRKKSNLGYIKPSN